MYHIAFNVNENYVKYLAVTIRSIIKHTKCDFADGGGSAR